MFLRWNSNREEPAMKRKLIFGLSLVLIICIIFSVNNKKQNPEAATTNEKYYTCITIEEDDTLWTIAEEYCTEEYDSYQEYIEEVKFINNLTDDTLYYGGTDDRMIGVSKYGKVAINPTLWKDKEFADENPINYLSHKEKNEVPKDIKTKTNVKKIKKNGKK